MIDTTARPRQDRLLVAGAAIGLYAAFAAWMAVGLGHDFAISDARIYWERSFFAEPFDEWWVPGYPVLLAAVRQLTGLSATPVLLLVAGAGFVAGALATYELARDALDGLPVDGLPVDGLPVDGLPVDGLPVDGSPRTDRRREASPTDPPPIDDPPIGAAPIATLPIGVRAVELALLFCLFPFVGLAWSVHPVADSVTLALLLWAAVAHRRRRCALFALLLAAALLTHKATWLFAAAFAATTALYDRQRLAWVVLAAAPLAGYLGLGALTTGDPLWFARWSAEHLMASRSALPILDGLVGTLLFRGGLGVAKSLVLWPLFALAVWVVVGFLRRRDALFAALAAMLVAIGVVLNQYEIWALARFSKLLVVPVATLVALSRPEIWRRWASRRGFWMALFLLGVATNVAWALYLRHYFAAA